MHGDVHASIARADALLDAARLDAASGVSLLLLPELAFTGYTFRDAPHIRPLAERCGGAGATHAWCARTAAWLQCNVVCGYVEEALDGVLYNAQLCVAPDGSVLANHRKHHLFATDETWAAPGAGWTHVLLPLPPGAPTTRVKAALGVCMDINPWEFKAPWHAFEWATAARAANASLLVFSSAWCDRSPADPPEYVPEPISADGTLSYWASRLVPLLGARRTVFVCADRIGREGDTNFCGCSCVMALGGAPGGGGGGQPARVALLGALGIDTEGLLLQDIDVLTDEEDT